MSTRLLLVAALTLASCSAAACSAAEGGSEPPPDGGGGSAGGCSACRADETCIDGACVAPPVERCRVEADPRCEGGTLCAVALEVLCPGDACLPETVCRAPVGERGGGYGCATSEECRAGACVEGLCVQLCISDEDCDTLDCLALALPRGGEVRSCTPTDGSGARDPTRPRCGGDTDCAEGQVCRRAIGDPFDPASLAFCAPFDEVRAPARAWCAIAGSPRQPTETGTPEALAADATCQHGDCLMTCGVSGIGFCNEPRCVPPCERDADCPAREVCAVLPSSITPHARPYYTCQPPPRGCFSERDCCPSADEAGCLMTWEVERTHCAPALFQGRFVTTCAFPEGRSAPGQGCALDADCGSGLCLPDAPGGVPACAFVCDEVAPETACGEATGVVGARCGSAERTLEGATFSVPVCLAP